MPTLIRSRAPTPSARLRIDLAPVVVVILLSLMFALAIWSAFAPGETPANSVAAAQIGF